MALEAKIGIPLHQHLVVRRPVWVMAGGATFPHRLVLEDERPALRDVALRALVALTRHIERPAGRRLAFVRVMAIAATHLSMRHRMRVRQVESPFHFEVALETDFRRTVRVDDRIPGSATFRMQASCSMARFAANVIRVHAVGF